MGIWLHPIAYLVSAGYSYRKTGSQNMRIPVYRKAAALRTMYPSSESALEVEVGSRQAALTSFLDLKTMMPSIQLVSPPALCRHELQNHCSSCRTRELCLPTGLGESETQRLGQIMGHRRFIPRDGILYRMNDQLASLYAIRLGHFKTYEINAGGEQQITGFQMAGELLGLNAISTGRHHCDAMALEDSEVCEIPFSHLKGLFGNMPTLLHQFLRLMSSEISQEEDAMLRLGNMRAEQRFAAFLVDLGSRYAARGYSFRRFELRMSREDIANYLGLSIESISRLLSKFKQQDWLRVHSRELELLDLASLDALATGVEAIARNGTKFAPWN